MKRGWQFDVEWFTHRWPLFVCGIHHGQFCLCLWVVDVTIWRY